MHVSEANTLELLHSLTMWNSICPNDGLNKIIVLKI